jgi:hypothetical protein
MQNYTNPPWTPPLVDHVKIEVDGAVSMIIDIGSYSAVCRSEEELYMGSSAMVCSGIIDPTILETLAYREALALAPDLNCREVVIASDCKGVVEDIQRGNGGSMKRSSGEEFDSCSFIYEGRAYGGAWPRKTCFRPRCWSPPVVDSFSTGEFYPYKHYQLIK